MRIFELKCTAYLKKDITFENSFEIISKYLSFSYSQNEQYEKLHKQNVFNDYCFGGFLPIESDKIYKAGNSYNFTIRGVNQEFVNYFQNSIKHNVDNPNFIVVQIHKTIINQNFITELYSATPVIVSSSKIDDKPLYWTLEKDGDIIRLQELLHNNLLKKYKHFFKEELNPIQNFIQLIEIKNRVPQTINLQNKNGKSFRLFGNKFRIVPNEDEVSQKLAFLALGIGLGEKNSYGGGFCISKGVRL
jgi:CRISPR-associated endoribonuclease Cas6